MAHSAFDVVGHVGRVILSPVQPLAVVLIPLDDQGRVDPRQFLRLSFDSFIASTIFVGFHITAQLLVQARVQVETDGLADVCYVICLVFGLMVLSVRFPIVDLYIGAGRDTDLNQRLVRPRGSVVVNALVLSFAALHCFCGAGIAILAFSLFSNTYHVRDGHGIHILAQRQGGDFSDGALGGALEALAGEHVGEQAGEHTDDCTGDGLVASLGASQAYGLTPLVQAGVFGSYALVAAMQLAYLHTFGDMGIAGGWSAWRSTTQGRGCLELTYRFVSLVLLLPLMCSMLALICPGLALLTRILSGALFDSGTRYRYVRGEVGAIWDIHGHATLGQGLAQSIVIFAGSVAALVDFELRAVPPPPIAQWIILVVAVASAMLVIVNAFLIAVLRPAGCCGWSHEGIMHAIKACETPCCR